MCEGYKWKPYILCLILGILHEPSQATYRLMSLKEYSRIIGNDNEGTAADFVVTIFRNIVTLSN